MINFFYFVFLLYIFIFLIYLLTFFLKSRAAWSLLQGLLIVASAGTLVSSGVPQGLATSLSRTAVSIATTLQHAHTYGGSNPFSRVLKSVPMVNTITRVATSTAKALRLPSLCTSMCQLTARMLRLPLSALTTATSAAAVAGGRLSASLGVGGHHHTSSAINGVASTLSAASRNARAGMAALLGWIAWDVRELALQVNPEDPKGVFAYYMHVWNIFYICYLLLPGFRV